MKKDYKLQQLSREELIQHCYELRAEVRGLEHALQEEQERSSRYVSGMVEQAQASDSMKLQLILSGWLRAPTELQEGSVRSRG